MAMEEEGDGEVDVTLELELELELEDDDAVCGGTESVCGAVESCCCCSCCCRHCVFFLCVELGLCGVKVARLSNLSSKGGDGGAVTHSAWDGKNESIKIGASLEHYFSVKTNEQS